MFLQDLLKKVNNFIKKISVLFSKENLNHLLINNFKEVVIIIICFGILVIIFTMFIAFCKRSSNEKKFEQQVLQVEIPDDTQVIQEELLLTPNDFSISNSSTFDITNDYIDFMPRKKYDLPDKNVVKKEYEKLLEKDLEESMKFNFEKRKNRE